MNLLDFTIFRYFDDVIHRDPRYYNKDSPDRKRESVLPVYIYVDLKFKTTIFRVSQIVLRQRQPGVYPREISVWELMSKYIKIKSILVESISRG